MGTGRLLWALFLAGGIVAGGGCFPEPQPPLRIATNVWMGYEPLYLARARGDFDESMVRLVEYTSATDGITAMLNRTIEAVTLTLDEALLLAASGADVRIVLVIDVSNGGDVLLAKPEIARLADLKNRRVGAETTALGAYMLFRALETAGMKPADVVAVSLPIDEHERAFKDGQVDAVVTFEPVKTRLLAAGARQLFDSSMIPGEVVDVLVVRTGALQTHSRQIDAAVRGWFRALAALDKDRRGSAQIMARRERVSADEFVAALDGVRFPDLEENRTLLAGGSTGLVRTAERLQAVMRQSKLLQREVAIAPIFDGSYVRRLVP